MAGSTTPANVVIRINDRDITNSFTAINKEVKKLERELKGMVQGTDEFNNKSAELAQARVHFDRVRQGMAQTSAAASDLNRETAGVSGTFTSLRGNLENTFASLLTGQISFRALGTTIKTFAAESWAAIGSIPVVGWVVAVVAAFGLGVREVLQYNEALYEANKLTQDITKLQGKELDSTTIKTQTLEELLGLDRKETLETARNLVQNFGITYKEAIAVIEEGAIRGGKSNTEFLKSMKEYPVFFAKAGFSVKEFQQIISAGFDLGIYDDKLPDAIKEFDLSMREQTKSTRDALVNAFGAPFADDILKRVSAGKTTVKDSLIEINKEAEKYNLTQKQQAQLTADIFRGAGEDVGGFTKIMDSVTLALIKNGGVLTEEQQIIKDQIDNYNDLGEAKNDALKSDSILAFKRDMENAWIFLKKLWYNTISDFRADIDNMYVSILNWRDGFYLIPKAVSSVFSALKIDFMNLGRIASSLGKVFLDVFNFRDPSKSWEEFNNQQKNDFSTTKLALSNIGKDIENIDAKNRKLVNNAQSAKATAQRILEEQRANALKKGNNNDGSEKTGADAKKAADKAAKEAEAVRKKQEAADKKATEERQKDLEDSLKKQADANNKTLEQEAQFQLDKANLKKESLEKDLLVADLTRSKELVAQRKQQDEIIKNIFDLEEKIKNAKSGEAKSNFENALKNERKLLQTNDEIILLGEDTYQKNLQAIREKWIAKDFEKLVAAEQRKIERARTADETEINNISSLQEAKSKLIDNGYLNLTDKELKAIDNLEDAKAALREVADRKLLKASEESVKNQISILKEALNDKSLTEEAKNKLISDLDEITKKYEQLRGAIAGKKSNDKKVVSEERKNELSQVDILGFSAEQWRLTFDNLDTTKSKLEALSMVFQAVSNAGQIFANLQRSLGERELKQFESVQNRKQTSLLNQLNNGYITNEQYNKEIQKLEAETANKKAEIDYKQAKADKLANMFSIIGSTAAGVAKALPNLILAGIVGGFGLLQLGIVAAQPLPERPSFADGGFTGSGFGAPDRSGFKPAGIVHEGEWTAPKWMVENPRTAKVIDYLESVRTGGAKPMADGGFSETSASPINSGANNPEISTGSSSMDSKLYLWIQRNTEFLEYLIQNGVYIDKTAKNGKQIQEMLDDWNSIKNKNKH